MTEWSMKDGDLVPDGAGGFVRLQGEAAVLQRVLFKLMARRGALPFLPELGSELHLLYREKPSARPSLCASYVAQALEGEDVTVTDVEYAEEGDVGQVTVHLNWQGKDSVVTARLEENG
ncbi:MAG: hypothetical protein E7450_06305 [Ruminococcaceae bacterium]|nr:hypothetical protein [Oscillospiraceae bacterium]